MSFPDECKIAPVAGRLATQEDLADAIRTLQRAYAILADTGVNASVLDLSDTYTFTGKIIPRTITTIPTGTATPGTIGEIVYSSDTAKFYGKHTTTASDTNWRLLGT